MIEAELPDGTVLEFPEGTSQDVIQRVVKQRIGVAQQPAAAPKQPSTLQTIGQGLASGARGVQEFGRDLAAGAVRGAGSIGATLLSPLDAAARALNDGKPVSVGGVPVLGMDRRTAMTEALRDMGADTESLAFGGGKMLAEIGGTAGAGGVLAKGLSAIPGVASAAPALVNAVRSGGMSVGGAKGIPAALSRIAGGAVTGGTAAGMVNPEEAGTGALVGGAIPAGAAVAGATGRALGRALRPSGEVAQIAQKAQSYGIPVGFGDVADNRMVQATRSILRDAPLTGGMAAGAQDAKQEAFNRAIGQTFGADAPKLTTEVVDQAKQKMGAEFDRIWNNNSLKVTPEFASKLSELKQLSAKLPRNEGQSLAAEIDDLATKVIDAADGTQVIPGDVANKFQQYLRRRAEGSAGLRNELGDMRQAIISAFNQSVSPVDAAALTLNRTQYKAFKTVEPLLRSAELGVAGRMPGDVPAALLPGAVSKSYSNTAGVPLADLAQVGSRFLVDRTPQTGGSARAALQNTAIGAALLGGGMTNPLLTAATVPGAIGVQSMLNSPALARAVMGQGGPVNPQLIQALRAAQLAAPVVSAQ